MNETNDPLYRTLTNDLRRLRLAKNPDSFVAALIEKAEGHVFAGAFSEQAHNALAEYRRSQGSGGK